MHLLKINIRIPSESYILFQTFYKVLHENCALCFVANTDIITDHHNIPLSNEATCTCVAR